MTYQKLGLVLTASSFLLTGCFAAAPKLTPAEKETRETLSSSNYQPATREIRDNIETQEILAQAAFWSHEYNLNPSDLESAIKFAAVLRKLGNPSRAVEVTRTTRALYPENPYLSAEYAASLLADQKTRPALKILDNALKDTPAYGRLWSLKGVALDQMEKYAEARPFYQRALQITPNDPNVMANMGLNFALSGDPHTAKKWLTRAAAHPDASDSVFANLDLVESLVAEAGPQPYAAAPPPPSYQTPTQRPQWAPQAQTPQAQAPQAQGYQPQLRSSAPVSSQGVSQQGPSQSPSSARRNPAEPRQYGAYSAGPQTAPLSKPQSPHTPAARAQNFGPRKSAAAYPQTYTSPAAATPQVPRADQPVPTSQDVLARIAENVKPKTAPRHAPRGYRGPYQGPAQQARGPQGQGYQQQAHQRRVPQGYQPQAGYADTRAHAQHVAPQRSRQAYAEQQGYGGPNYNGPNRAAPAYAPQGQYQGAQAPNRQYQTPPNQASQYQGGQYQGGQNGAPQYRQAAPQIRGGYPAPQAPYYGNPNSQPQTPPQRRAPARRRG